ncbi:RNA polymerase sigma factor [Sulfuriferula sp.]|uniref:RNA polymerase sigma factor n=1 Tax=Sulfuriferula sp. TaxID=2025307 RepID=UPI00272EF3CA|nr:sigma-70 family RNA polymerase sigma factor [Sulfuriferula sp.]MDP2024964.1 sigma-70 family RNA polymerase sigma factor [Sulfuriferula sp.]
MHPSHAAASHRDYLYGYAIKKLGDAHLADDLVQETLLAALQSSADYAGRSAYRVWLVGILKHKMMDAFRQHGRHVSIDTDDGDNWLDNQPDAHSLHDIADSLLPNPQKQVEMQQLRGSMERAFSRIPDSTAAVFYAREIDGEPAAQVAQRLGISEANVWVRVYRARKAMQVMLGAAGWGANCSGFLCEV